MPTGRPRTFDPDTALEVAMRLFWENGYEATGVAELTEAMGIHKGSLYKTFGDKKSLFLAALRRYLEQMDRGTAARFAATATPVEALRTYLAYSADGCAEGGTPGCLAVNTLVEMTPGNDEARSILMAHAGKKLAALTELIAAAQKDGSVRRDHAAEGLAQLLLAFSAGLMVFRRAGIGDTSALADAYLDTLRAP